MDSHQAMGKIFNNLTMWRNLPKYQLERRADMFFGLYVKDIVEYHFRSDKIKLSDVVIPEFPIGKNIIEKLKREKNPHLPEYGPTLQSVNVDYVLFGKNIVYFIELKTDMGSRDEIQDEYLEYVDGENINQFLDHIKEVKNKGNKYREKYQFLWEQLKLAGLVLEESHYPSSDTTIKVVYIQPSADKCITFPEISEWLQTQEGDFPAVFAHHLKLWGEKAGTKESIRQAKESRIKPVRCPVHLPAHIGYLVHQLREEKGISLDISVTPLEDPETFALIQSGDTNNIPMLDSKIVQECLIMFKPATIEELATALAITSGGVRWSGGTYEFIERHHRRKEVEYDLPELKPILDRTFGIIVYAEQVIKIVEMVAGFSSSECINLMQGQSFGVEILQLEKYFLTWATGRKCPADKIKKLFSKIAHFSQFDFYDESYAKDYALAAYRCAYLKAHYPDEYNALFGIYSEPHPLIEHEQLISQKTNATTATIDRAGNNAAVRISGYIYNFKEVTGKKGDLIGLGDLEDQHGFIRVHIPQEVLTQHREKLQSEKTIIISGIFENSDETGTIKVEGVEYLISE